MSFALFSVKAQMESHYIRYYIQKQDLLLSLYSNEECEATVDVGMCPTIHYRDMSMTMILHVRTNDMTQKTIVIVLKIFTNGIIILSQWSVAMQ